MAQKSSDLDAKVNVKSPDFTPQLVHLSLCTSALSHMVCPKSNSHVYKMKKVDHRRVYLFLFCYLGSKEVLLLGEECPIFKRSGDWPINVPPFQIKNKIK
jgi:hypothetical protein